MNMKVMLGIGAVLAFALMMISIFFIDRDDNKIAIQGIGVGAYLFGCCITAISIKYKKEKKKP